MKSPRVLILILAVLVCAASVLLLLPDEHAPVSGSAEASSPVVSMPREPGEDSRGRLEPDVERASPLVEREQVAAAGARLLGRCVDGAGLGLAGVRVTASSEVGESPETTATSGADGGFELVVPGTEGAWCTVRAELGPTWSVAEQRLRLPPQGQAGAHELGEFCLLYTSPSPRDQRGSRMPSSA